MTAIIIKELHDKDLHDKDLHNNKNKYSIDELVQNIDHLSLWDIVQTQTLTADFCFTYVWSHNDEYAKDKEDKEICEHDVLHWQPHLTKADLYSCEVYKERKRFHNKERKMNNNTKLTCNDLRNNKNKYSIEELERNIRNLQIKMILTTQTLTADFCAKYVLDEYYATCMEDVYLIDFGYVLYHQPHITREELEEAYERFEPEHKGSL